HGSDGVTYHVVDELLTSGPFHVAMSINPVDDAPVAGDDSYVVDPNATLVVDAAHGVLANDTDVDSTTLTAALVTAPSHGTLTLNVNGSFSYTPDADYHGIDSFVYIASDGLLPAQATTCIIVN